MFFQRDSNYSKKVNWFNVSTLKRHKYKLSIIVDYITGIDVLISFVNR